MVSFPPQASDSFATDNRMPYCLTAAPQAACTERGGETEGRLCTGYTAPKCTAARQSHSRMAARVQLCLCGPRWAWCSVAAVHNRTCRVVAAAPRRSWAVNVAGKASSPDAGTHLPRRRL